MPNNGGLLQLFGDIEANGYDVKNTGIVRPRDDNAVDIGTSLKRFRSAYVYDQLVGPSSTRAVDDIVSQASAVTAGHLCQFIDNNEIKDSTIASTDVLTTTAAASTYVPYTGATSNLAMGANSIQTPSVDASGTVLAIGATNATAVNIAKASIATNIAGKAYLGPSFRPVMSGGFAMITNTTVQNTTTETSIIGAGVGTLASAANTISAGNCSKMLASGSVTTAGGAQTLTLRVYGGPTSTLLLATLPIVMSTLLGTPPAWRLDTMFSVKTIGASGTVQLNSTFVVNDTTVSQAYVNQNLATINTTVANVISLKAQWTTANASNVLITNQLNSHSIYVV